MNDIGSTLFLVFVLVVVLVGAYYTTRFLSRKARQIMKSKHIHVLDRMGLAKDKALFLTKVGGRCFFIGVTNQAISMLGELAPEELENVKEEQETEKKSVFSKFSDFLAYAKSAPDNLRKVREEQKQAKTAQPVDPGGETGSADDDYIDQITRSIAQRKAERPRRDEVGE